MRGVAEMNPRLKKALGRAWEAVRTYYPGFRGRATRRELLIVVAGSIFVAIVNSVWVPSLFPMSAQVNNDAVKMAGFVGIVNVLLLMVAILSAMVRRLHDTGKNAWYLLISFFPYIGMGFLVWALLSGPDAGENEYGPNPRH